MKNSCVNINIRILTIFFSFIILSVMTANSQDESQLKRLTSDLAQEGFPSWSPDGKYIIYSYVSREDTLGKNGLWKMNQDGGDKQQIFSGIAEHPQWSPDDRFIVFDADTGNSIKMIPVGGGEPIKIIPDTIKIVNGGMPCWSPDGSKIAFLVGSTLSVCIVDIDTRQVTKIFDGEGNIPMPGCWTPDGKNVLIALMNKQTRLSTLWKISVDGKEKKQITGHHENLYRHLALSPDGSLLVYAAMIDRKLSLRVMPVEGGKSIPFIVSENSHNEGPSWSPDGKEIAFNSTRSGNFDIWLMDVDIEKVKKNLRELNK